MGDMSLALQGVYNEDFGTSDFFDFRFIDRFSIGYVRKLTNPESQYRHHIVHHFNRLYNCIEQPKRLPVNLVKLQLGNTRVPFGGERIVEFALERFMDLNGTIYVNRPPLLPIECTHVV